MIQFIKAPENPIINPQPRICDNVDIVLGDISPDYVLASFRVKWWKNDSAWTEFVDEAFLKYHSFILYR